jgi:hypothetical protein
LNEAIFFGIGLLMVGVVVVPGQLLEKKDVLVFVLMSIGQFFFHFLLPLAVARESTR